MNCTGRLSGCIAVLALLLLYVSSSVAETRICLNMIAKDEAREILSCLNPLAAELSGWTLCDTGGLNKLSCQQCQQHISSRCTEYMCHSTPCRHRRHHSCAILRRLHSIGVTSCDKWHSRCPGMSAQAQPTTQCRLLKSSLTRSPSQALLPPISGRILDITATCAYR
jgi:hypothetical protein